MAFVLDIEPLHTENCSLVDSNDRHVLLYFSSGWRAGITLISTSVDSQIPL